MLRADALSYRKLVIEKVPQKLYINNRAGGGGVLWELISISERSERNYLEKSTQTYVLVLLVLLNVLRVFEFLQKKESQ